LISEGAGRYRRRMSVKRDKGDKDEVEWIMIGLDPKMAKRQGLPAQIPLLKTASG
jgi:hypothetical protein